MTTETKEKPRTPGVPPPKEGQSSENKVTPKTYSEADYLKAVSDERTVSGRLKADLEKVSKERDTFKTEAEQAKAAVEEATSTLEETKGRIAELETDLETAIGDNLDLAEIQKIKRELRAEKTKLSQEAQAEKDSLAELKKTLEKEREEWAGTVAEAQASKFEVDVFEVAEEYGGDAVKLKAACERAEIKSRDKIQGLAEVFWTKKTEPKGPDFISDSGVTNGSKDNLGDLPPKDRIKEAERRARQQK